MANENLTVASAAVIIDELLTMAMRPNEPYEQAAREAALQSARDFLIAYAAEHGHQGAPVNVPGGGAIVSTPTTLWYCANCEESHERGQGACYVPDSDYSLDCEDCGAPMAQVDGVYFCGECSSTPRLGSQPAYDQP